MAEATFMPDRLRVARELKMWNQNELARHVSMTPAAVGQFESGSTRPAEDTITRLAEALEVPVGFLTSEILETHEGFFRATRRTPVKQRRRARALAHIAHDLARSCKSDELPPVNFLQAAPDIEAERDAIEEIAADVRRAWGVPPGPIEDVVALMEQHGIVVTRLPLDTGDVDAFSLPFHDRPVVVLGADKDDRARSRFDAAHELGHLVMHNERVWGLKAVEDQAHWFAAAFLMPRADIIQDLPSKADWQALFKLKQHWQVSLAALLMRAKTLETMDPASYLAAIKAASARGWRRREPVPLGHPEQPRLLPRLITQDRRRDACQDLPQQVVNDILRANAA
ncbi:XRE family transcriptional regulator [Actinoplanes sp. NPDC051411]|uniref:XRE family transcriptional regulator n=1 Tax=Actinoplanes sp. NPDC051411 TaxID=3155522 RepID=UPI00342FEF47